MSSLYPHQEIGNCRIRAALLDGCKRLVVQAPTGSGKTLIAAELIRPYAENGMRAIFCAAHLGLINQTIDRFQAEEIDDIGVIQADHQLTRPDALVQICSIQTLKRRSIPKAGIVFIDECHVWHEAHAQWITAPEWVDVPVLGLSASPWRKGLGKYFDKLIKISTTQELIAQGYLCQFRAFAPSHPDLRGISTVAGEFHQGELSRAMSKPKLIGDVVSTYLRLGERRKGFVFAVDCAHAQELQKQFNEAGVPCGYVDSHSSPEERAAVKQAYEEGDIQLVCNVNVMTTGIDWNVHIIVMARPTKSEILFVQTIGRGLRTAPGKSDCLILDHSDNHRRFGFVTDVDYETLDDGIEPPRAVKKPEDRGPNECPECGYLKAPGVHKCPECGFAPARKSLTAWKEGELVAIKGREAAALDRAKFYGELKQIALDRGYKPGWAWHKFNEKFGEYPTYLGHATPVPASAATLAWVKSRVIAFAKARARYG